MISASWPTLGQMLAMSHEELAGVDPVVMNIVVAKGIPSQADLNIQRYVSFADSWSADLAARLPKLEEEFHKTPEHWKNDLDFFRLGLVCWYVDVVLKVAYREDQRELKRVLYKDPSDLFLNGVMDTRRGTCGNMALLNVVIGRRFGWPVSLACLGSHFLCRFDDGSKVYNIETTQTGRGGFSEGSDEQFLANEGISPIAQDCGSDLRAVTPREMLGLFVGLRARHLENVNNFADAERDYLLARYLFPNNRQLYINQHQVSVQQSMDLFDPHEKGHPIEIAEWFSEILLRAPWLRRARYQPKEAGVTFDAVRDEIFVGGI